MNNKISQMKISNNNNWILFEGREMEKFLETETKERNFRSMTVKENMMIHKCYHISDTSTLWSCRILFVY